MTWRFFDCTYSPSLSLSTLNAARMLHLTLAAALAIGTPLIAALSTAQIASVFVQATDLTGASIALPEFVFTVITNASESLPLPMPWISHSRSRCSTRSRLARIEFASCLCGLDGNWRGYCDGERRLLDHLGELHWSTEACQS